MKKIKMTRIKVYVDGEFTSFELLYPFKNHCEALDEIKKEYPQFKQSNVILIAETVEEDLEKPSEWYETCLRCGSIR
jgi:hypothetical protein